MRYSNLCQRLIGDGAAAWDTHLEAMAAQERGADVVVLSVGDPDFDTPAPITAAAKAALDAGDTHYCEVLGRDSLRDAIAADTVRRSGAPLTRDNVAVAAGTQNALFCAAALVLQAEDDAVALSPMYVTYEASIRASGANLIPAPCPADRGWRPDLDALEAAITPETKAIFYASPVNPTGCVLTREEIARIADLAVRHDLWIVADEVYADLTFDRDHVSILAFPEVRDRAIVCSSLSKSHAMTGWRAGWAVGPELFIEHFDRLALAMTYGLPGFVQAASEAALTGDQSSVQEMRAVYLRRRELAARLLAGVPGVTPIVAEAGMFMLLDVRQTGLSSGEFMRRLYAEDGVSVLDAATFGPEAAGAVRLSFATSDAIIQEGCARIRRFAERL